MIVFELQMWIPMKYWPKENLIIVSLIMVLEKFLKVEFNF